MKHHLKLFLVLSLLTLILIAAGCGGGSSNEPPRLSTDYYGLEVGAQFAYTATMTPGNLSDAATYEILSEYLPGVFRTCFNSSDPDGEFIKKDADGSYYEVGYWETDNVDDWVWYEEPYELIVKNPVSVGFESDWWGEALRQESVTVPAGTFNAWVFYSEEPWSEDGLNYIEICYYWFVPYLGWIKTTSETTKQGSTDVIESTTAVLQSYSFGASKSSLSQTIKYKQTIDTTLSSRLRKLLRHK